MLVLRLWISTPHVLYPGVCSRSAWGNLNLFSSSFISMRRLRLAWKGGWRQHCSCDVALDLWDDTVQVHYFLSFIKLCSLSFWGSNSAALRTALRVQILFDSHNSVIRLLFFLKGEKKCIQVVTVPGRNGHIWPLRFICGSTAMQLYHFAFQKVKRWFIVGCFRMHRVFAWLEPPKRALYIFTSGEVTSKVKVSKRFH